MLRRHITLAVAILLKAATPSAAEPARSHQSPLYTTNAASTPSQTQLTAETPAPKTTSEKPNIIFIISDDHRWDCIGAAGNPNIHTPHLDRLAAEGVYFPQATIHNPQCSPSRAALITGLSTHTNGRVSNQSARADIWNSEGFNQYLCTPEAMAANGYATALVGKWHLNPKPWNVGFEKNGVWLFGAQGPFKNAVLGKGRAFSVTTTTEFTQTAFANSACDIISAHANKESTRSLFLWVAFTAPHSPYRPNPASATRPYAGKAVKDVLPPAYNGDLTQPDAKHWLEYVAAITSVDEEVGKIRKTVEDAGLSSNTVICFIGDNGYMMGSRGMNGKGEPWEESIRVPLVIWGPGVFKANGKTDATPSSLDLPPTFVRLAGGTPPREWQGRDLTPVLDDLKPHNITFAVTEAPDHENYKFPGVAYRTVRTSSTKLIVWHEKTGKTPEFYDLATDPYESTNVYKQPAYADRVRQLHDTLSKWMSDTNDNWQMQGEIRPTGSYADDQARKQKQ